MISFLSSHAKKISTMELFRLMDVYSEVAHRNSTFLATKPRACINSTSIRRVLINNFVVEVTEPCRVLRSSRRCGVICCFGIDSEVQSHVDKSGSCDKGGQRERRETRATAKEAATLKRGKRFSKYSDTSANE